MRPRLEQAVMLFGCRPAKHKLPHQYIESMNELKNDGESYHNYKKHIKR